MSGIVTGKKHYGGNLKMKHINKLLTIIILFAACNSSDNDIKTLLLSKNINDLIEGSYKAGELRKAEFIPYLLCNANDPRVSTNLRFMGFSVYQEKMMALKKILKKEAPVEITWNPDSTVIRFYTEEASKYIHKR